MRLCTGNPAYRFLHILLAPPRPTCTLARRSVVGGFSDLLGEDVCVTGVAGDFTDHAQVDEAHAYCADEAVRGGDLGEGFVLGYVEAAVTADRKAGAVFETPASQGALKPVAFRGSTKTANSASSTPAASTAAMSTVIGWTAPCSPTATKSRSATCVWCSWHCGLRSDSSDDSIQRSEPQENQSRYGGWTLTRWVTVRLRSHLTLALLRRGIV